ncbi:MAG: response regulator [Verrucomicrobiota bacterium]|nr:response regulator [Limisphaera sp.]MDW8382843.1 response regulator [Verrucomicrobiota bacterium]
MRKRTTVQRRILVVDDEALVCEAMALMLAFDGHQVQTASNGVEALNCLAKSPFDLVITDYAMPEMRGDELAKQVALLYPRIPVVMITAHAEVLAANNVPLPGVSLVLSKPFMLDTLRNAIEQVCPAPATPSQG